ncbi:hypothetical protein ACFRBW_39720, partial [Streptomyces sp. NPDC056670]
QVVPHDKERVDRRGRPLRLSKRAAYARLREFGFAPEESYPGKSSVPWKVRCVTCGSGRTINIGSVRRCKHRIPPRRDEVAVCLTAGQSVYEIAEDFRARGIWASRQSVRRIALEAGFTLPQPVRREDVPQEELMARLNAGEGVTAIMRSFWERGLYVSGATLRAIAKEQGFTFKQNLFSRNARRAPTRTFVVPLVDIACRYARGEPWARIHEQVLSPEEARLITHQQVAARLTAAGVKGRPPGLRSWRYNPSSDQECLRALAQAQGISVGGLVSRLEARATVNIYK